MRPRFPALRGFAALAALFLSGCVYVPQTTTVFDEHCQIQARHMSLKPELVQGMGSCQNQGCAGLLAAAGVVTAASVVVSGSIVVAGNIVYWFEKQGQCNR